MTKDDNSPSDVVTADVVTARLGLHAVAELLLAGPQWRTSGTIRLTVTQDGFATIRSPAPGIERLAVSGGALVRAPDGLAVPLAGPFQELASTLGIRSEAPDGVYPPTSVPPESLELPATGVDIVLNALILGDRALRALTATTEQAGLEPVLWPEHFDVSLTLDEVNFGVSPGDAEHPLPYAYVGPWSVPQGAFWNEPFGASRALQDFADVTAVTDFLLEGRARAAEPSGFT